jgi:DNA-directed RNA polymerase subunit RPC12/RpoP
MMYFEYSCPECEEKFVGRFEPTAEPICEHKHCKNCGTKFMLSAEVKLEVETWEVEK